MEGTGRELSEQSELSELLQQSVSQSHALSALKDKIERELEAARERDLSHEKALRDGDEAASLARRCIAGGDIDGAKAARLCASMAYTAAGFSEAKKKDLALLDAEIKAAMESARKEAALQAGEMAMQRARESLEAGDIDAAKAGIDCAQCRQEGVT